MWSRDDFYKRFYTSLIEPQISDVELAKFIDNCKKSSHYIAGIAVNLHQITFAARQLLGSSIDLIGAVAYPLGNLPTELKVFQMKEAINDGADQVDIVMRLEALKQGDYKSAREDVQAVVEAGKAKLKLISLIPKTAYLTDDQKIQAAKICVELGTIFRTNTDFSPETKLEEVQLIRKAYGEELQITVSGRCLTPEQAIDFLELGANRIASTNLFNMLESLEKLM